MEHIQMTITPEALILDLPEKKLRVSISAVHTDYIDGEADRTGQEALRCPHGVPDDPLQAAMMAAFILEEVANQPGGYDHGR